MTTAATESTTPVTHVHFSACEVFVHGERLSPEAARDLFSFAVGAPFWGLEDRIARARSDSERLPLEMEQQRQNEAVHAAATGFCAMVTKMFRLPPELIELRVDGARADLDTMNFSGLERAVRNPASPRGYEGRVPVLVRSSAE